MASVQSSQDMDPRLEKEAWHEYIWTHAGILKWKFFLKAAGPSYLKEFEVGHKITPEQASFFQTNDISLQKALSQHWLEKYSPELEEDRLDWYLRNPSVRNIPDGYVKEKDLLRHCATGVLLLGQAMAPLRKIQRFGGDLVLYHYCPVDAFRAIQASGDLLASTRLNTDCDFGVGQYATKKQPHRFRTITDILYNNYPRATSKYRPGDNGFPTETRASHCIPLLVSSTWTPSFPLTDPLGQRGAICETGDRYGTFDATHHDIWLIDTRFAEGGLDAVQHLDQPSLAFLKAAEQGQVDLVKHHLQTGSCDVDAVSPDCLTALHLSAYKGHIDTVRELLSARADVNLAAKPRQLEYKSYEGSTAFSVAASAGHIEVARFLVSAKADVKCSGKCCHTRRQVLGAYSWEREMALEWKHAMCADALVHAVRWGTVDMVRLMLSAQADIGNRYPGHPAHPDHRNVLATAIRSVADHGNVDLLRELISCRADVTSNFECLENEAINRFHDGPLRKEVLSVVRDARMKKGGFL